MKQLGLVDFIVLFYTYFYMYLRPICMLYVVYDLDYNDNSSGLGKGDELHCSMAPFPLHHRNSRRPADGALIGLVTLTFSPFDL